MLRARRRGFETTQVGYIEAHAAGMPRPTWSRPRRCRPCTAAAPVYSTLVKPNRPPGGGRREPGQDGAERARSADPGQPGLQPAQRPKLPGLAFLSSGVPGHSARRGSQQLGRGTSANVVIRQRRQSRRSAGAALAARRHAVRLQPGGAGRALPPLRAAPERQRQQRQPLRLRTPPTPARCSSTTASPLSPGTCSTPPRSAATARGRAAGRAQLAGYGKPSVLAASWTRASEAALVFMESAQAGRPELVLYGQAVAGRD